MQKDCPSGELSRRKFLSIYSTLFPEGKAGPFYEHVFRTFDEDGSGRIDFKEFLQARNSVYFIRGSLDTVLLLLLSFSFFLCFFFLSFSSFVLSFFLLLLLLFLPFSSFFSLFLFFFLPFHLLLRNSTMFPLALSDAAIVRIRVLLYAISLLSSAKVGLVADKLTVEISFIN